MSLLWAAVVIGVATLRLLHHPVTGSNHGTAPSFSRAELSAAIADYEALSQWLFCYSDTPQIQTKLYLLASEDALTRANSEKSYRYLQKALQTAEKRLACRPHSGKAWLDYMLLLVEQEGFSEKALHAFKQSAFVAPNEAWLAEKRTLFALIFLPLLDKAAIQIALHDSRLIQRSLKLRRRGFLAQSGLSSLEELAPIFNEALEQLETQR